MVFTPWFRAVHPSFLLEIVLPQKTFPKLFYKPKEPFEMDLRAPIERPEMGL